MLSLVLPIHHIALNTSESTESTSYTKIKFVQYSISVCIVERNVDIEHVISIKISKLVYRF